ncbi:nucleotidyltransferase [Paenibacillus sp. LS1]|uniref:nucleotidyltransferase domain-containing protein n=1 Tax=Paenibacillus sp. LS1 TaxID=2992120 RepID=UPI00222FF446|nr:nucleotidyltransferase [Paenibacillus sp. LS1]MCW3794472.1 nucleotidyltransferase [Paenibacillus sp. LS1]
MVHCQTQFIGFHDAIKLSDENETLQSKRKIILDRLKDKMPSSAYSFEAFNQGSYAMKTGIKPLDGNSYDIDLGLYFDMSKDDVATPVTAKKWVYDALEGHTNDVKMKHPCVTVKYQAGYHVDVTIYAASNEDEKIYLAKGKLTTKEENQSWNESNPKDLIEEIRCHFTEAEDRKQFRRVIRYLKRWKDEQFSESANGRPTGIALTAAAYHWLDVKTEVVDSFSGKTEYRDLDALIYLVKQIIAQFTDEYVMEDGNFVAYPRINIYLPVEPKPDLCERMTLKQMKIWKEKLEKLLLVLEEARECVEPSEAAEILKGQFGTDFPVPVKKDTGKRALTPALIPSSESAL